MTNGFIAAQRRLPNRAMGATMPSQAVLDKIADKSISGGYNTSKANRCTTCFCAKPVVGSCCDD